jgi:hypothetical protein
VEAVLGRVGEDVLQDDGPGGGAALGRAGVQEGLKFGGKELAGDARQEVGEKGAQGGEGAKWAGRPGQDGGDGGLKMVVQIKGGLDVGAGQVEDLGGRKGMGVPASL